MSNRSKSLDKIIRQGKLAKIRIDNQIKSAISKVGRADYQFLHSNCHVRKQTYSNGRIKSMIIEYRGRKLVIDPGKKKDIPMIDGHPMTNAEVDFAKQNHEHSYNSNNQYNRDPANFN